MTVVIAGLFQRFNVWGLLTIGWATLSLGLVASDDTVFCHIEHDPAHALCMETLTWDAHANPVLPSSLVSALCLRNDLVAEIAAEDLEGEDWREMGPTYSMEWCTESGVARSAHVFVGILQTNFEDFQKEYKRFSEDYDREYAIHEHDQSIESAVFFGRQPPCWQSIVNFVNARNPALKTLKLVFPFVLQDGLCFLNHFPAKAVAMALDQKPDRYACAFKCTPPAAQKVRYTKESHQARAWPNAHSQHQT